MRLIFNIHSFVDVITNSSSELFICDRKDISIEFINIILKELLNLYNNASGNELVYENVIGSVDIYTQEKYLNDYENTDNGKYMRGYEKEENIGKIFIESKDDNSIPYAFFDFIEDVFDSQRYHLG
jgi:hypothetical protein